MTPFSSSFNRTTRASVGRNENIRKIVRFGESYARVPVIGNQLGFERMRGDYTSVGRRRDEKKRRCFVQGFVFEIQTPGFGGFVSNTEVHT
jgi:hypothetical protein